jgi:uncharacterized protein DUF3574
MHRRAAIALLFVLASCAGTRFQLFEVQESDKLYFGTNRPGGTVSDAEWRDFVDQVIVPSFPGFTELEGTGYWKGEREKSHIIIVTHPRSGEDNGKIHHIIDEYKKRFMQEAVFWEKSDAEVPVN